MIVLDSNVLSELLRPAPEGKVLAWLSDRPLTTLFTTTITQAEIQFGVRVMPEGQRRRQLWDTVHSLFNEQFAGRILSFDSEAALAYAEISASRRFAGKPISQFDAMIAAMVRSRGATLATRNVRDFIDCGIELFDPWSTG